MFKKSSYRDTAPASPIVNFYVEGLSAREIAARMGCGKSTVLRRLHELGISVRSKGDCAHRRRGKRVTPHRPDILDSVLVHLYANGLSTITIAKQLGCHPTTVSRRLKSAGTKLRPEGF